MTGLLNMGVFCAVGCAQRSSEVDSDQPSYADPPQVVAVTPALNLSNSVDWDPLQFTDLLASELQTQPGFFVIPVNRTVAQLNRLGKATIETPSDAEELARELDADGVVVAAITEFDPYDPPRASLILQYYAFNTATYSGFDPVAASRRATDYVPVANAGAPSAAPTVQIQASFDASEAETLELMRTYAAQQSGRQSPHDWRYASKSQREFLRFCSWASIVSMRNEWRRYRSQRPSADIDP